MVSPYRSRWDDQSDTLDITLAYPENYDVAHTVAVDGGVTIDVGHAGEVLGVRVALPRSARAVERRLDQRAAQLRARYRDGGYSIDYIQGLEEAAAIAGQVADGEAQS